MEKRKFEFEVEINFKEVFRNPARWFGYVFIYVVLIIFALGLVFLSQLDFMFKNAVQYNEIDSSRIFKEIQPRVGGSVQGVKFEEISPLTPDLEKKGEELFKSTCASCHGEDGKGKGVASAGLNPPPRNFTSKDGWKNGFTPLGIYTTLQLGIPGSAMVAYDYIPPKDKIALIYYITKFLGEKLEFKQTDYDEINNQFKISESRVEPSQIPIALAKTKIINENADKVNQSIELSKRIINKDMIISKYINDPIKAANFLVHLKINKPENINQVIIANIPSNGFSYSFVNINQETKGTILSEINELLKN